MKNIAFFIILVSLITVGIASCTSEKQYRVLSFFFDGVPNPKKNTVLNSSSAFTLNGADTARRNISNFISSKSLVHKPYEDHKCTECHSGEFSNELIKPVPALCYTCHEDFNDKYRILHGPAASGYCLACHNQHEGIYPKLLTLSGRALCFNCHQSQQVLKNKKHEKIGNANCIECHDPHGGESRAFLKQGICYQCHDNFSTKYNFVHGPVVSGNCTACHDSHSSQKPKLLLRESQQICLYCHDATDIFNNINHKKVKKKNCTECHNPHGGEDRFILTEILRPYKTKPLLITKTDSFSKEKSSSTGIIDSTSKNPNSSIDSSKVNAPVINAKKDSTNATKTLAVDSTKKVSTNDSGRTTINNAKKDSVLITPTNQSESKFLDNLKEKLTIDSIFKKSDPIIEIKTEEGLHKYLNGSFYSLEEAVKYRDEIVKKGYKDAFIVAYKNNKRVPNTSINTANARIEDLVIFRVQVGAFANEHPDDINKKLDKISDSDIKKNNSKDSTTVSPKHIPEVKPNKTDRIPF